MKQRLELVRLTTLIESRPYMANRHNHYEAAFEAYLRQERIAYVAVDEKRRTLVGEGSLKSLDFIVSPNSVASPSSPATQAATRWLVDVKGRKFPSGVKQPQYWRNWSTEDDLRSLARWRQEFGPGFDAALVFAYQLTADRAPTPPEQVFPYRDASYAFVGIGLDDYLAAMRPLSAKWKTVSMPVAEFRQRARPLLEFLAPATTDYWPRDNGDAWESPPCETQPAFSTTP